MSLKFMPKDFMLHDGSSDPYEWCAKVAQAIFDAWLEAQPVVFFYDNNNWREGKSKLEDSSLKARLVCVEEVEEIEKKPHEHSPICGTFGFTEVICNCGVKLKAK